MPIPDRVRYAHQEIDTMVTNDHSRGKWQDMEYEKLSTALVLLGDLQVNGGPEVNLSVHAAKNSIDTLKDVFRRAYSEERIGEERYKSYSTELSTISSYLDGLSHGTKRFKK